MCGIVGVVDKKRRLPEEELQKLIRDMRETLIHRGDDNHGEYVENNVALGHARLSFLDPSPRGAQPMRTEHAAIIYNGEVYNFAEVKKELAGIEFKTNTDTEVILRGYEKWGAEALSKFKGMWAFAILDKRRDSLFLSLDRLGIKPLYYINNADFFAFASEIKALLLLQNVKAELNDNALPEHFLFRYIAGRETLFKGIYKMLPAEYGIYDFENQTFTRSTYWRLTKKDAPRNPKEELKALLKKSVSEHLIADVSVGVQLSGGVDSSLVAALAREEKKTGLHSFSIGLKDKHWNEFDFSQTVAKKLGTEHHELLFSEKEFCKALPLLTYHMDEPIGHSHSVPMYLLARFAREKVKALLSGEGADEVFGGYRRYESILEKKHNAKELVGLAKFGDEHTLNRATTANLTHAYDSRLSLVKKTPENWSDTDRLSYVDLFTYLPSLLLRQDKMGMAATLENRVPFLDHELVEFGFSLPPEYKVRNDADPERRTKPLLKELAEEYLPREIIYRPKVGFGQPIAEWLKNPNGLGRYLNPLLTSPREFYNKKEIRRLIHEHQTSVANHAETLWILLNLELWSRIFLDGIKPEDILKT